MASKYKGKVYSISSPVDDDFHERVNRLVKQLLCSPPDYYQTQTWLNHVIQMVASFFPQHVINMTACKIMVNGYIKWCTSLKDDRCYCKKMSTSYCCQQWMAGKVRKSDLGKLLYQKKGYKQTTNVGVILHMDDTTARALVAEINSHSLHDKNFSDSIELVFSVIAVILQNHLLKAEHDLLQTILKEAGDSVELTDTNAIIEYVNPAFEKITGYTLKQAQGKTVAELIRSPSAKLQVFSEISDFLSHGKTWKGTIHSRRKDGQEWVAQAVIIPIKNFKGEVVKHLAIKQDITMQHYEQQKLKESEKRYRGIMDSAFDGVVIHDLKGQIRQVNRAVCQSLGYTDKQLTQMHIRDIEVGVQEPDLYKIWQLLMKEDLIVEGRHKRKDGSEFPIEVRLSCLIMDGEKLIIAMIRDISEAKEYEQKLLYKANYDDLTKLPNRAFGLRHLQATLNYAVENSNEVTVLFLDLDNFKQVNDSLGHFAGDQLLLNVSKRLTHLIRENDFVARLSGDEFMIVMPDIDTIDTINNMIERLQLAFAQPFHIEGQSIHISSSIGVSRYPHDGDKSETLLRHADIAMYQSKSSGRGGWKSFVPDMVKSAIHDMQFENAFRQALSDEDFDVYFQPIIDCHTGRLICFEALLRWFHVDMGQVKPTSIIDFAEQVGLAQQLSRWILAEVCRKACHCLTEYNVPVSMSINVSAHQINQSTFVDDIKSILSEFDVDPTRLIIEVTESTLLLGKKEVHHQLNQLKELGIAIAIDDFGVGYSSFSYLKDFPFSYLKIDKSFINQLTEASNYTNIVKSIVTMAHCMNLKVVAEGVETKQQAEILRQFDCDYLQGWLIAKALPIEHLSKWLKK